MKKLVNYEYVDMSAEEISQHEQDASDAALTKTVRETAYNKKVTDKAAGNQKLKDLGLTDDEISALVG